MKRFALALLPLLAFSSPAFALVGGPFDQNTFGGNSNPPSGTYQGILSGDDIAGVMIFGTSSTSASAVTQTNISSSTVSNGVTGQSSLSTTQQTASGLQTSGNEGRVAIFDAKDGVVVIGEMSAVIDIAGRSISGVMEGSQLRSQQTLVQTISDISVSGSDTATSTSLSEGVSSNTQTFTFNDVVNISGNFNANITSLFPALAFDGDGSLTITAPPPTNGSQGPQVQQKEVAASDVPLGQLSHEVSRTTELVPVLNTTEVSIQVSGVRTANSSPTFAGNVQVQQSSIVAAGATGATGG